MTMRDKEYEDLWIHALRISFCRWSPGRTVTYMDLHGVESFGKEHWVAATPPEAYLREILIHTPWSTDPAVAALADELHRRGYAVWKGVDLNRVLQPGLILEYAAPFDVLSLGQRIAARGVVAVADEAIREDESRRGRRGR